jgi:hypothetical protein
MSCIPINDFSLISLCDATKAGKLYSIVPDDGSGDFDVARNSTATYVGADGLIKTAAIDEPRIEFNLDGSYKGLLVEPQRTNLVFYSEEFDDAYWTKQNGTVTANTEAAPDGTTTADTLTSDGGSVSADKSCFRRLNVIAADGNIYSRSIFLKKGNTRYGWISSLNVSFVNNRCIIFDFDDEVVTFQNEIEGFAVEKFENGWYRLSIAVTAGGGLATNFSAGMTNSPTTMSSHNNNDFIYAWGAQVEAAPTASSYIKTEASTVTRVADVISNDLSALVTGDYSMVLDVEANVGRLKVFEALTGFDVDLTGSGRMVVTVDSEITLHFPDGRTLEFLKPSDFVDLEFVTKLTSNHVKVVATLNRIINQSEIDGLVSGNLNSPLLDTGSLTDFEEKYRDLDYDFFGKIDTSSGSNFVQTWQNNNLTSFPLIDTSSGTNFTLAWRDNNLTSFPLIDTSSGTSFFRAWRSNNLTSFPLIDTSSGTNFSETWRENNLQTWPANMFDTCPATDFTNCWLINALDQTGVDNILVSINKARVDGFSGSDGVLGINGGTNATPGAAGQAAADALRADGWTLTLNGY